MGIESGLGPEKPDKKEDSPEEELEKGGREPGELTPEEEERLREQVRKLKESE